MRSLGGELAQHVFIRELAAAECGVRQVVYTRALMTVSEAGVPPPLAAGSPACHLVHRSPACGELPCHPLSRTADLLYDQ